ncbi:hypothetical protein [Thioalkalivibrio sp. ALE31]|uniref:hypothetical protein n=1 Tax=Thioalkalivibrio sp. ALE31 TaxID=1158182 RepID=UPI0012DF5B4A|nr:hypothetical protein [Thioalkalivibrio sp. ALE31]
MKDNQTSNIASAFFSNIQGGELFLYCTSALAPVFYMALYERPGVGGFPNRSGHIAVVVILMIVCGAVFSLIKGDVDLHQEGIIYLSLWLYPISVLLLYLATVYHSARHPKNPAEKMRSQEEDFLKHFNDRHSGKG